jgi:uncharacterized protein YdhG (YjbR/CyaY superfamily)
MKQPAKKVAGKAAKKSPARKKPATKAAAGFSAAEQAAMKDYLREKRGATSKADGEAALLAKVAAMPEPDRGIAMRLHAIVKASAPALSPKTWYGMPAYANADGKVVCFFQPASKFGARYGTFGFNDAAKLDDGAMWPTGFALAELTAEAERKIAALVERAAG